MPDAIYVADERTCKVLDARTGDVRQVFPIDVNRPDNVPVSASDIRVTEDMILIAVRFNKENAISKGRWNSELLVALDPDDPEFRAKRLEIRARSGRLSEAISDADWFIENRPDGTNADRLYELRAALERQREARDSQ